MNHIAYYNEIDPFAAQWLRNLIDAGHIAPGVVDERSITEVTPDDVKGFTQCHFFAGIGGWPLALHLAGFDERHRIWTGSPPCQPFSTAGKQLGQLDERHLAPTFMRLVAQCRPSILFGEQVAAAISKYWLDDLFTELEGEGYACGAAVLPACSVGAPHKRDRLYFGARLLADGVGVGSFRGRLGKERTGQNQRRQTSVGSSEKHRIKGLCSAGGMAHANNAGLERRKRVSECSDQQPAGASGLAGGLADSVRAKCDGERLQRSAESDCPKGGRPSAKSSGCGNSDKSGHSVDPFWAGADWLSCRDGKFRPVESGAFPLADGISARVGRLRGYGNAIVPQVAAQFITAFMAACND